MASTREVDTSNERCPDCGSGFAKDHQGTGFRRHLKALPKRDRATQQIIRDAHGNPVYCGGTRQSWGKGDRSVPVRSELAGPLNAPVFSSGHIEQPKRRFSGMSLLIVPGICVLIGVACQSAFVGLFAFFFILFCLLDSAGVIGAGAELGRRRPTRHRWLTNGLRPRRMHWGPRRLF